MNVALAFIEHLADLESAGRTDPTLFPSRLAVSCAAVLPVAGAGISVFTPKGTRVPIGASHALAASAERLQFTTGEGPCLTAARVGYPMLATEAVIARQWPQFSDRLHRETLYRAVIAVPLATGRTVWGSVDLFFHTDTALQELPLSVASVVVELIGTSLLNSSAGDDKAVWLENPTATSRQVAMIAVGLLNVALNATAEQALDILRAHAYALDTTVDALADDLVNGRLSADSLRLDSDT